VFLSFDFKSRGAQNSSKMQKSEKFFIFSWKELVVIGLLVLTTLGFFFTLGLHYGKKIKTGTHVAEVPALKMEESPDLIPPKASLEQGSQRAEGAAQEAIKVATDQALKGSEVKLDHAKPVDLPTAKAEEKPKAPEAEESADEDEPEAPKTEMKTESKFAIQLGSYPSKELAQKKISLFTKRGLKTEVRMAVVNGETRYRVVLPGFKTKKLADIKGKELHSKRKVESFVVIKSE